MKRLNVSKHRMPRPFAAHVKRCLIMGASGFLGSSLRRDLAADDAVTLINGPVVDLRQPLQVKNAIVEVEPDVVVNLAGISSPASDDVVNLYQVNALGHLNILQAASTLKRKPRVILASSAQLYGPDHTTKATEQTPLNPVSHYGLSKLLAEKYCELFSEGVQTVVARLYNAIGRGQSTRFLLPKLVQAFKNRAPRLEIGSVEVERDYIDTRDLSAMWRLIVHSDQPPPVVNFSNGEAVPLDHIISRLKTISGHQIELVSQATYFRKNDISYLCGDNSVVRKLGYVRRYSLDDTLAWMLDE